MRVARAGDQARAHGVPYSAGRVTELKNGLGVAEKTKTRSPSNGYVEDEHSGEKVPTAKTGNSDYVVAKNDEEEATFKQYKRFDNTRVIPLIRKTMGVVMEKKRYK